MDQRRKAFGWSLRTVARGAAWLGCVLAGPLGAQAQSISGPSSTNPQPSGHVWQSVNTRGMGFVDGGAVNPLPPYNMYIRTDVGGAYRFDRAGDRWVGILDTVASERPWAHGVESIATAPSLPNRVAVAVPWRREIEYSPTAGFDVDLFSAEVLISDDAGKSWKPSGLANIAGRIETGPNGAMRGDTGERLAFDPHRADIIYFASRSDGLWRKVGSAGWQRLAGLPDPETLPSPPEAPTTGVELLMNRPGYTFVAFDPRGPRRQACQTVYVGVWGSGVWRSTDAGNSWAQVSNRRWPGHAAMRPDGTLFVAEFQDYQNGAVSKITPAADGSVVVTDVTPMARGGRVNRGYGGITIDPKNPNIVLVTSAYGISDDNFGIYRTVDGGNSWVEIRQTLQELQIDRPGYYLWFAGDWGRGMLLFDPADPNPGFTRTAFAGNGFGVVKTEQIGLSGAPQWAWKMNNLEEAIVHDVTVSTKPRSEGGPAVMIAAGDILGFSMDDPAVAPQRTIIPITGYVPEGSSVDFSWGQPDYVAFVGHNDVGWEPYAAVSRDGGRTFENFAATLPGAQGGRVALATNDGLNMVYAPSNWYPIHFTRDGGQSWTQSQLIIPGEATPTLLSWQLANQTWKGQVLASSPVLPNTFYLWSFGRVLMSTNGGQTWSQRFPSGLPTDYPEAWSIDSAIIPHPANGNELWITTKPNTNQRYQSGPYRSVDGGLSFQRINSVIQCNHLAFGKGYAPGEWVVYIHGKVQTGTAIREGIFRSTSSGAAGSWEYVGPTDNVFPTANSLAADPREPGIVYVGTGGRGVFVGRLSPPGADIAR